MRKLTILLPLLLVLGALLMGSVRPEGLHKIQQLPTTGGIFPINPGDSGDVLNPVYLVATPGDGTVGLTWNDAGHSATYDVYRYFDGASATLLQADVATLGYDDDAAVNGSPHSYYVVAQAAGYDDRFSNIKRAVPISVISQVMPRYSATWYASYSGSFDSDDYDDIAQFDHLTMYHQGIDNDSAFQGFVDSLRTRNPDITVVEYIRNNIVGDFWNGVEQCDAHKAIYAYCLEDTVLYPDRLARWVDTVDANEYIAKVGWNATNDNAWLVNIFSPGVADVIAEAWADDLENSYFSADYTGAFIDTFLYELANHICNGGACRDAIDFDRDGVAFNADKDEQLQMRQFHLDFLTALRREFAERDMGNRIITANADWVITAGGVGKFTAVDDSVYALLDGLMNEGPYRFSPGPSGTEYKWRDYLAGTAKFTGSQLNPPLRQQIVFADSSGQFVGEPFALAVQGFGDSYTDGDHLGRTANQIPDFVRSLPDAGAFVDTSYNHTTGILEAEYENLKAFVDVSPDTAGTIKWFAFHNSSTRSLPTVDQTVTSGHTQGVFKVSGADSASAYTGAFSLSADTDGSWPITLGGNADIGLLTFDISEAFMDYATTDGYIGYEVLYAELRWTNHLKTTQSGSDSCYVIGVDDEELIEYLGTDNPASGGALPNTDVSWAHRSGTTRWDTQRHSWLVGDWGTERISFQDGVNASDMAKDVTRLVAHNAQNQYERMVFAFGGEVSTAPAFRIRPHNYTTTSQRPALLVRVKGVGPLPYLVLSAEGDTLSRGGGWPRQD